MYNITKTWKFKRDYKKIRFNKNIETELRKVLNILVLWKKLPAKFNFAGFFSNKK